MYPECFVLIFEHMNSIQIPHVSSTQISFDQFWVDKQYLVH